MTEKNCACCGQPFLSDPRVKNQTFCSAPDCQKERRKKWRQTKMLTDKDYRVNKSDIQRSWLDRNPDYWRNYRSRVNSKPKAASPEFRPEPPISGIYRIRFMTNTDSAKSDAWIAEISPVCTSCPCKVNECKDST